MNRGNRKRATALDKVWHATYGTALLRVV